MTNDNSQGGGRIPVDTGILFVGTLIVVGACLAVLFKMQPILVQTVVGQYWMLVLLVVALVFDLVVNQLASRGRMDPLAMPWRFGGFAAGVLVHLAIMAWG